MATALVVPAWVRTRAASEGYPALGWLLGPIERVTAGTTPAQQLRAECGQLGAAPQVAVPRKAVGGRIHFPSPALRPPG
jgi:hypothetical protein